MSDDRRANTLWHSDHRFRTHMGCSGVSQCRKAEQEEDENICSEAKGHAIFAVEARHPSLSAGRLRWRSTAQLGIR